MDTPNYILSITVTSQLTFHLTFSFCRYKLPPYTSQCVRRAVEAAARKVPEKQQGAISQYLALKAGVFGPQDIVDAALMLESLAGYVSSSNQDIITNNLHSRLASCPIFLKYYKPCIPHLHSTSLDDTSLAEFDVAGSSMDQQAPRKDFVAFVERFPVLLGGQPPSKKQRVESGFPDDRILYDKWRAAQYTQREEYMLCKSQNPSIKH